MLFAVLAKRVDGVFPFPTKLFDFGYEASILINGRSLEVLLGASDAFQLVLESSA